MRSKPRLVLWLEEGIAFASLAVILFVPFFDKIVQKLVPGSGGIRDSHVFVSFSVIALCFSASILTNRDGKHLNVGLLADRLKGRARDALLAFNAAIASAVSVVYLASSLAFIFAGVPWDRRVLFIPERILTAVMPLAFLVMSVYFITQAKIPARAKLAAAVVAYPLGLFLGFPALVEFLSSRGEVPGALLRAYEAMMGAYAFIHPAWVVVLVLSAFTGAPIFTLLGGLAFSFFTRDAMPIMSLPSEPLLFLRGDMIPALPLFTLTGYVLSESGAGKRLIEVFKSLFGWLPGGMIIVSVLACTFFTTFTGASGITILALGGILAIILSGSGGYDDTFTHGLLTSSGSIGALLPPSLAVIIYSVVSGSIDIWDLFRATAFPGILLVVAMCIAGILLSLRMKAPTIRFDFRAARAAIVDAAWELLLPVGIFAAYALGWATIPETASFSLVYALAVEVLIKREIPIKKLPGIMLKALSVVGGTLIILLAARGLSLYIILVDLPSVITAWISSFVTSKFAFLVILNILLLVVGCFLDIFSAITVVAPLLFGIAAHFGVAPVHLASIFLVNLCIGFLTPPVGMNLFLASYTFDRPLTRIYRSIAPFLLVQLGVLVLVTYVPWLSTNTVFASLGKAFSLAPLGKVSAGIAYSGFAIASGTAFVILTLKNFGRTGRIITFAGIGAEAAVFFLYAFGAIPLAAALFPPIACAIAGGILAKRAGVPAYSGATSSLMANVLAVAGFAERGRSKDGTKSVSDGKALLLFILSGAMIAFAISATTKFLS